MGYQLDSIAFLFKLFFTYVSASAQPSDARSIGADDPCDHRDGTDINEQTSDGIHLESMTTRFDIGHHPYHFGPSLAR